MEKWVEKRIKAALSEPEKRAQAAGQRAAMLEARLVETEISRGVVEGATKLGLRAMAIADITARTQKTFKIVDGV